MSFAPFDLGGRRAVVTGAGKGIGRAVSLGLAQAGADIFAFSRSDMDLTTLQRDIQALGRRCYAAAGDVSRPEDVLKMAQAVHDCLGGADILVNNAGIVYPEPALHTSLDRWSATLAVNLTGAFLCAQALAPGMLKRGWGRIINISAQSGVVGTRDHAAYCASKGGLNALTRVLAIEWGPQGVTVNAVAPTVIRTPMGERVWGNSVEGEIMRSKIPIGRFGEPHEVAAAVVYLASDAAALVNGHILLLDGGFTAM